MDYSKSGSHNLQKSTPRGHIEHNQKGGAKNPYGRDSAKQDLIARMKAAAAKKAEETK